MTFFSGILKHVPAIAVAAALSVSLGDTAIAQEATADDGDSATPQAEQMTDAEQRALQPLDGEYGSEVEKRWRAILDEQGLQEGENARNVFIASGLATVAIQKGAPGWIESRRVAHDVAFARAKATLVAAMGQKIQRTGSARFTSNASFGQGQMQQIEDIDQTKRILDKAADLTEASLDAALREIDPDYDQARYEEMAAPEKQVALENVFEQTSYRAAARVIAGATTYRVIEGPAADGQNHQFLVAMVWSPRLSALAAAIQDGRTEMPVEGVRSSVQDMRPKSVGDAVAALGTRVFINENGDRALISFAQTEPAQVSANDRDMARRAALSAAEDLALGQIASFVGENVALESETQSRQVTQVYADLVQRGVDIDTEQVQTIRSASGLVEITGAQPVWRQVVQHPETEQDIAIVAVAWSPSSQAMGDRMGGAIDEALSAGTEAGSSEEDASDGGAEEDLTFESEPVDPDAF
jgi:hypothetical protein